MAEQAPEAAAQYPRRDLPDEIRVAVNVTDVQGRATFFTAEHVVATGIEVFGSDTDHPRRFGLLYHPDLQYDDHDHQRPSLAARARCSPIELPRRAAASGTAATGPIPVWSHPPC